MLSLLLQFPLSVKKIISPTQRGKKKSDSKAIKRASVSVKYKEKTSDRKKNLFLISPFGKKSPFGYLARAFFPFFF
jgi:hypothetical protein